ncbi:MAG: adenosylcobinamide-GDP ribazoletransferase [Eubacteriales bacterium]|nr:adenosylcobinamide-GDP ribazoletransferase [Lachnospiraceae bacterium]MDO5127999.1 adenosylcobinamide-GDP ribazoletransferase [Eubacteriales bacterium]
MLRSFIIAFSTYSKVPMPKVTWDEKGMRYSMCFFPFVGVVIGACQYGILYLSAYVCTLGHVLGGAILTVIPILITGGIHMDGFLDTVDAKSSYKTKEEKLIILKDPHTGAFAIIYGIVYMILYYAMMQTVAASNEKSPFSLSFVLTFALSYVWIRVLSGISVLTFKKAKTEGMLAETAKASDRSVLFYISVIGVLCAGLMIALNPIPAFAILGSTLLVFLYYRLMSYRVFGGITGDLAGYFLQLAELASLGAMNVVILTGGTI